MSQVRANQAKILTGAQVPSWRPLAFLALAIVGLGISIYLTLAHYEQFTLACTTNSVIDCTSVTHSVYAQFFGSTLPVSAAGLAWFAVAVAIGTAQVFRARTSGAGFQPAKGRRAGLPSLRVAAALWSAAGLLYVLYLVYVELVRVNRICEWCTAVHLTVFAMLLIVLRELQQT